MVIRNIPAVVRVPFFQMQTDPENYFYSLLVQYVPYYFEDELIDEHNNAREALLAREEQLRKTNAYLLLTKYIVQETDNLKLHSIKNMLSIFLKIQKKLLRQNLKMKLPNRR
ncbi:hypothetical protein AVEN_56214-1 [Araneus ventricosus]|uniref:Uncharacterized protein n=1 Tax=Araneus ventricosus TaxID=182803 RepID=A0A4Y2NZI0_ARAVE|nr:hypothetical protein AVEN_56214-1 [Araneus ventricosus]